MNVYKVDVFFCMDDLRKIIFCCVWKLEKVICCLGWGVKRIMCKYFKLFSE